MHYDYRILNIPGATFQSDAPILEDDYIWYEGRRYKVERREFFIDGNKIRFIILKVKEKS